MQMPRVMAMVDRRAAQAAPMVKPNWSGEARLPVTVRVPVPISNAVYGNGSGIREVHIKNDGQELPTLVITWMQGTPQYRTWFLQGEQTLPAADIKPDQPLEGEMMDMTLKTGEATNQPRQQQGETIHVGRGKTVEATLEDDDPGDRDKPVKRGRKKSAAGDKDNA